MDENLNRRLAGVARIAVRLEAETGVPARLLIAQWAVESKWGAKPAGNYNHFGIKKAARHTKCCTVMTREVIGGEEKHFALEHCASRIGRAKPVGKQREQRMPYS